jgi:tRNA(adenine34) deaminase
MLSASTRHMSLHTQVRIREPPVLSGESSYHVEAGLAAGELPIGAVVVIGDDIVASAFTQDRGSDRRPSHADLLAMVEADQHLGWRRREHPLRLAVNLEPCLMCMGAAMSLGVAEVHFSLSSPGDGAASVAAAWQPHPDMPWFTAPTVTGGIRRDESRAMFRRYCRTAPESGLRRWAQTLAQTPD